MLIAVIEDGKEGIGLERMDPANLSPHQKTATEVNSKRLASTKAKKGKER